MRAALALIHITVAYILLRGWPEALPMWLRAALALIVIMLVLPLRVKKNKKGRRSLLTCLRRPHWLDFLYIGAVIVAIELLLLSVFTLFPKEAETIASDLHTWVKSTDSPDEKLGTPDQLSTSANGNWLWDNHSQRPLASVANKQPSNKPDIFIDLLTPEATEQIKKSRIYVKSFSLDYFDGQRWSIHQPSKFTMNKAGSELLQINDSKLETLPIYMCRITKTFHNDGQNVFSSLQNALNTEISSLTKVSTDTFLLPQLAEGSSSYNYITTSQPLDFNIISRSDTNLIPAKPPAVNSVYLSQVTDYQLQQNIAKLAETIPQDLSTTAKLIQIRKLIRKQSKYSLDIENPKQLSPIDNFLFHEKKGYCEHFATASALLCREHGIPSRISYGWTGGKNFVDSNLFVFLSKNAHAWTEIYLERYGWVIFDTTPASYIQPNEESNDPAPKKMGDKYGFDVYDSIEDTDIQHKSNPAWKIPVMILGIGMVFTTLVLLLRRISTTPKISTNSSHLAISPPKYLSLFEKLSAKLGHTCHQGTTLSHNINELKKKSDTVDHRGLEDLLDYHYNITYRNAEVNKNNESKILKFLKKSLARTEP